MARGVTDERAIVGARGSDGISAKDPGGVLGRGHVRAQDQSGATRQTPGGLVFSPR